MPEYEKAANILHGVVKVASLDATESEKLAGKYGIQGFPTLKIFGADKKSPVDYQGQRTADGIVSELMKSATALVKDRKNGGSSKKSSSSSSSSSDNKAKGGKSEVIELTSDNFESLVLKSDDHWMVEFFAPW